MIYASDLDKTLIYSSKSMLPLSISEQQSLVEVERKDGEPLTYMTAPAIELLKQVSQQAMFIPVTTRTLEQFHRIELFQTEIKPKYAITSNGGNILTDGEIDQGWEKAISIEIGEKCLPMEQVLARFKTISSPEWVFSGRVADDYFYYCIIDNKKLPVDEILKFKNWLDNQGWHLSLQGRKLYFAPRPVDKWRAIDYIKQITGDAGPVVTSGDSLLDYEMLKNADYGYCPPHGELSELIGSNSIARNRIILLDHTGIKASEHILNHVLEICNRSQAISS